jgi:hypothetical protein
VPTSHYDIRVIGVEFAGRQRASERAASIHVAIDLERALPLRQLLGGSTQPFLALGGWRVEFASMISRVVRGKRSHRFELRFL